MQREQRNRLSGDRNDGDDAERRNDPSATPI
jgi:hypothetical protein